MVASPDAEEVKLLRRHLAEADVKHPLLTFSDRETVQDYLTAVCVADTREPRFNPCLLFLDGCLLDERSECLLAWIGRQRVLEGMKVVVLSEDRAPVRPKSPVAGAVEYIAKFPAAATLALIVSSACGTPPLA